MKLQDIDNYEGKELLDFLFENKHALINQKKSILKHADPVTVPVDFFIPKGETVVKATSSEINPDATSVRVKVVANTANYCDSHMDVLMPDCWSKSIKERKGMIPHLHDHKHSVEAEVGEVKNIYTQDVSLSELGLRKQGTTQCLVFETDIQKSYNEKVFNRYKAGRMNQHSIGLQYVKIELGINDTDYLKEKETWDKYIGQVINRKYVEERGFFWAVTEIKLLENSCVLFGANELTPTLNVSGKNISDDEPEQSTHTEPSADTQPKAEPFDFNNYLKTVKIFTNV